MHYTSERHIEENFIINTSFQAITSYNLPILLNKEE